MIEHAELAMSRNIKMLRDICVNAPPCEYIDYCPATFDLYLEKCQIEEFSCGDLVYPDEESSVKYAGFWLRHENRVFVEKWLEDPSPPKSIKRAIEVYRIDIFSENLIDRVERIMFQHVVLIDSALPYVWRDMKRRSLSIISKYVRQCSCIFQAWCEYSTMCRNWQMLFLYTPTDASCPEYTAFWLRHENSKFMTHTFLRTDIHYSLVAAIAVCRPDCTPHTNYIYSTHFLECPKRQALVDYIQHRRNE